MSLEHGPPTYLYDLSPRRCSSGWFGASFGCKDNSRFSVVNGPTFEEIDQKKSSNRCRNCNITSLFVHAVRDVVMTRKFSSDEVLYYKLCDFLFVKT